MIPLFERYRSLRDRIPYVSLADLPTPVEKLDRLGADIGLDHLYVKRDDMSAGIYGGNKVRKLEFLMGRALQAGAREVLTFGCAGSNHALATAVCARQLGLRSISMLMPQPNAQYVRRNLLASHHYGAELHLHRNAVTIRLATVCQLLRHRLKHGQFPQMIHMGGSSPLGTIGFVNAAFELSRQIADGLLPEPDRIYVALGSMGTAAGLMLGLKAANLKTQVVPVRVLGENYTNARKFTRLFGDTNALLCAADPSFPRHSLSEEEVLIRHDQFGQAYALFTEAGTEALKRMEASEGIKLEGTYTGKALAALIADAEKGTLRERTVLFWHTYNARSLSDAVDGVDYRQLPRCFHTYFEQEVQPLDRPCGG